MSDRFRFGIEEEYFLADVETGESPDGALSDRFHDRAGKAVKPASHEVLKGQVEVQCEPSDSLDAANAALSGMRRDLAAIAAEHGLRLFAAGSHPLAESRRQATSDQERYKWIESEFGIIARHSMVSAMHVHVEVPDPSRRIDLVKRLMPFLPLIYALSTASPFWQGRPTGLHGFRLTAFSEWPRAGLPDLFVDDAEYERYVRLMVDAGVIEDASFLWWYIRPSAHYPTIELRICDSCTRLEDAVAIAAFYRCLARAVARRPDLNAGPGAIERAACADNIWQAQKNGLEARFIDVARRHTVSVADALEEALDLVAEDAAALQAEGWVGKTRSILERGTSAKRQLARFETAKRDADDTAALRSVIAHLAEETVL